ncbi:hypothetical protein Nepgr_029937 [Nepenthes gracilis]|uniref:Uncharacterized protein n=1 Tax=Nepenthes gracilis TaxID=150966 RepID=A0AAD3Y5K8_NEPGR|nr:hypothetical protein Nepgr_029937 [Nepenthes gracilis]
MNEEHNKHISFCCCCICAVMHEQAADLLSPMAIMLGSCNANAELMHLRISGVLDSGSISSAREKSKSCCGSSWQLSLVW